MLRRACEQKPGLLMPRLQRQNEESVAKEAEA